MKKDGKPTKNHWLEAAKRDSAYTDKGLQQKKKRFTLTGNRNMLWALRVKVQGSPYRFPTFVSSQGLHQ